MIKKDRQLCMLNFEKPDRIPLLGGFVVSANHYIVLSATTADAFFERNHLVCATVESLL